MGNPVLMLSQVSPLQSLCKPFTARPHHRTICHKFQGCLGVNAIAHMTFKQQQVYKNMKPSSLLQTSVCHTWCCLLTQMLYWLINNEPISSTVAVLSQVPWADLVDTRHAKGYYSSEIIHTVQVCIPACTVDSKGTHANTTEYFMLLAMQTFVLLMYLV
jgi:hypothetical protein